MKVKSKKVKVKVKVKRWSVVAGGNKRMGGPGLPHATGLKLREPSQKENLSGRTPLFNERC